MSVFGGNVTGVGVGVPGWEIRRGGAGAGFIISAILESEEKVSEDEETGVGGCEAVTGEGGS